MSLVPYVHLDASLQRVAAGGTVPLSSSEAHHLTTVLRLRPGAAVEVADGAGGSATAELGDHEVRLVADPRFQPARTPRLRVAQALSKGRKLDEVVRQVTELGADGIVPVTAARSVTRLDVAKASRALERWRAIARAASEQARRPWRPHVEPITDPAALVSRRDPLASTAGTVTCLLLVGHPGGRPLPSFGARAAAAAEVTLAIGPEGGWTEEELAVMVDGGATTVGLGDTILRTEHAGAAGLAVLAALLGRWG